MKRLHPDDIELIAEAVARRFRSDEATAADRMESPPRCTHGGFIYFIQAFGPSLPTKIGMTKDIARRLKTIRSSCPFEARLIAFYWSEDPQAEEAGLHERFAVFRLRGEWFTWHDELKAYVEDAKRFKVLHTPHDGGGLFGALTAAIGACDDEEIDEP